MPCTVGDFAQGDLWFSDMTCRYG